MFEPFILHFKFTIRILSSGPVDWHSSQSLNWKDRFSVQDTESVAHAHGWGPLGVYRQTCSRPTQPSRWMGIQGGAGWVRRVQPNIYYMPSMKTNFLPLDGPIDFASNHG
eukprot:scaffold19874_cov14-Tisochrysis_lutea.AAC.1